MLLIHLTRHLPNSLPPQRLPCVKGSLVQRELAADRQTEGLCRITFRNYKPNANSVNPSASFHSAPSLTQGRLSRFLPICRGGYHPPACSYSILASCGRLLPTLDGCCICRGDSRIARCVPTTNHSPVILRSETTKNLKNYPSCNRFFAYGSE